MDKSSRNWDYIYFIFGIFLFGGSLSISLYMFYITSGGEKMPPADLNVVFLWAQIFFGLTVTSAILMIVIPAIRYFKSARKPSQTKLENRRELRQTRTAKDIDPIVGGIVFLVWLIEKLTRGSRGNK